MSDTIHTQAFYDKINVHADRPPGSTYKMQLAILPYAYLPKDAEWAIEAVSQLAEDDWFLVGSGPHLVLGEAVIGATGKYWPAATYNLKAAIDLTRRCRAPQKAAEAKRRAFEERDKGFLQMQKEKEILWRRTLDAQRLEEARRDELAKANTPAGMDKRIKTLENKVGQLELLVHRLMREIALRDEPEEPNGAANPEETTALAAS